MSSSESSAEPRPPAAAASQRRDGVGPSMVAPAPPRPHPHEPVEVMPAVRATVGPPRVQRPDHPWLVARRFPHRDPATATSRVRGGGQLGPLVTTNSLRPTERTLNRPSDADPWHGVCSLSILPLQEMPFMSVELHSIIYSAEGPHPLRADAEAPLSCTTYKSASTQPVNYEVVVRRLVATSAETIWHSLGAEQRIRNESGRAWR